MDVDSWEGNFEVELPPLVTTAVVPIESVSVSGARAVIVFIVSNSVYSLIAILIIDQLTVRQVVTGR